MPRKSNARGTIAESTAPHTPTGFEKESAAAAASVDILDSELATAFGFTPTGDQFINDFDVERVASAGAAAAASIGVASVIRNGGNTGFTVTFTAAAAAATFVKVRVNAS